MIAVYSFARYLVVTGASEAERAARAFVCACKGDQPAEPFDVPVAGRTVRLTHANYRDAAGIFAEMVLGVANELPKRPCLMPIPNSTTTLKSDRAETHLLAEAVKALLPGTSINTGLRFTVAQESARRGLGTRDPQLLYDAMAMTSPVRRGRKIILVDDFFTSGGHLQAGAALVRERGGIVEFALCVGRRATAPEASDPFSIEVEHLADFTPK